MSPSRRRISPSRSEVAAAVAVRNSLKMNSITYGSTEGSQPRNAGCGGSGGWERCGDSRQDPRKHDVGSQRFDQFWTDPRHAVEPRHATERPMLLAPRDDALRERGTDPGQACDLGHVGAIEIHALAGEERAREPRSGARSGAQGARGRRVDAHELHVAGRGGPRGRQREAHASAGEGEEREQEGGTAVVHDRILSPATCRTGIRFTRGGADLCQRTWCVVRGFLRTTHATSRYAWHRRIPRTTHYAPTLSNRSEEHTSELQSHVNLVCRLLLEKKKT